MPVTISVSVGECLDKLSILEIKAGKVCDERRQYIQREMTALVAALTAQFGNGLVDEELYGDLVEVNSQLWDLEDGHRLAIAEALATFSPSVQQEKVGQCFEIGEQICRTNDRRAAIKDQINQKYDGLFREIKQLPEY